MTTLLNLFFAFVSFFFQSFLFYAKFRFFLSFSNSLSSPSTYSFFLCFYFSHFYLLQPSRIHTQSEVPVQVKILPSFMPGAVRRLMQKLSTPLCYDFVSSSENRRSVFDKHSDLFLTSQECLAGAYFPIGTQKPLVLSSLFG